MLTSFTPKKRDAIDRIWSAIRVVRRELDIPAIAMTARAPESSTGDYVRLLVRAGYLCVTSNGHGKAGQRSLYRLVRDSGPKAPRRAITVMADANTGATYALPLRRSTRSNGRPQAFALMLAEERAQAAQDAA